MRELNLPSPYFLHAELQQLITADLAWHFKVLPKEKTTTSFCLYVDEEQSILPIIEELEVLLGCRVELESAPSEWIMKGLGTYYRTAPKKEEARSIPRNTDFVDRLLGEAKSLGSSDIHIEIFEEQARVRMRLDGQLVQRYVLDRSDYPELVNKIKIRSNLDISEKRLPQDGRIQMDATDIRVSILPTLHGEKIVLRLLGKDAGSLRMEQLGFSDLQLKDYLEGVKRPNGIILISGPTGSGKTTTLYATLQLLNEEKRNIVTVEDPIEYTLQGINQVQLKEAIGLTFASALRSFLRQDPDVIMLGEIRDAETAQMAIRAALTGHLVLSTIHTNSAWGTISRLIDMGVPPFLLASTMNTTVAQRLVRKVCTNCKTERPILPAEIPPGWKWNELPDRHMQGVGCDICHYTGYKGRVAIYEVIPIHPRLAQEIKLNTGKEEEILRNENIKTLKDSALELLTSGETSLDEVYSLLSGY